MHISESFLQDLNSSEHSNPGLTGSRELLMLIFAGPCDFNQPGPGFCWPRLTLAPILQWTFLRQKPPWICMHPQLKTSPILLLGGGCFGKYSWCFLYLSQIKSFLFLLFVLVVPFGSTSTKRWTQFQVTLTLLWPLGIRKYNTRVKGTFHVQKYKASLSPKRELGPRSLF